MPPALPAHPFLTPHLQAHPSPPLSAPYFFLTPPPPPKQALLPTQTVDISGQARAMGFVELLGFPSSCSSQKLEDLCLGETW